MIQCRRIEPRTRKVITKVQMKVMTKDSERPMACEHDPSGSSR
jgi:hypothetical protein